MGYTYCWPCAFCSCAQQPVKCKQVKVINQSGHQQSICQQMQRSARGVCALVIVESKKFFKVGYIRETYPCTEPSEACIHDHHKQISHYLSVSLFELLILDLTSLFQRCLLWIFGEVRAHHPVCYHQWSLHSRGPLLKSFLPLYHGAYDGRFTKSTWKAFELHRWISRGWRQVRLGSKVGMPHPLRYGWRWTNIADPDAEHFIGDNDDDDHRHQKFNRTRLYPRFARNNY